MSEISIFRITSVNEEILEAAKRMSLLLGSSNQVNVTPEYLERITVNPDNYWLMARRLTDSRLVGMASLIIMPMPTNIRASLENVAVDQDARGLGVGTALCNEARVIADGLDVNTLRAAASPENLESQTMLKNAGFAIDQELDYFELDIKQGPRV